MPILNDIVDWVENKPEFWQVAIDRLIRNNQLSEADILEIKEICKMEFGLSDIQFEKVDFEDLREFADSAVNNEDIILSKISNVQNIKAPHLRNEHRFYKREHFKSVSIEEYINRNTYF